MNKQEIEKAIETLNDFNKCIKVKADGAYEKDDFIKAKQLAISALEQQLTGGWIPVSERLPEDFEFKRVYLTVRSIASEHCFVIRAKWSYGRFKHLNGAEISNIYEIVAWREEVVPEPYKEVSE